MGGKVYGNKDYRPTIIDRNHVEDFINKIFPFSWSFIGSCAKETGNKDFGDIDIAIHADIEKLIEILLDNHREFTLLKSAKLVTIPFIYNDNKIQVDLMPTKYLEFTKLSYFSPKIGDSKYKGLYRNEILFAIAKNKIPIEFNENREYNRYWYDLKSGLLFGRCGTIGKSGKIVKDYLIEKYLITANFNMMIKIILGKKYSKNDANSFENIFNIVKTTFTEEKQKLIFNDVKKGLTKKKLEIPIELL